MKLGHPAAAILLGIAMLGTGGSAAADGQLVLPPPVLRVKMETEVGPFLSILAANHPWAGAALAAGAWQMKKEQDEISFWIVRERSQPAAAAQVILAGNPIAIMALRLAGKQYVVWDEPEFIENHALLLNAQWLHAVRDKTPMPDFRGKAPDEISKADEEQYLLYCQALVYAFRTPLDAFMKSSEEHGHVKFAHLYNHPGDYRGKVIPVRGRLKQLRKFDAPRKAQEDGVRYIYEGWIATDTPHSPPFCVVMPRAPEGIKLAESMDRQVAFYGYFYKLYRYAAQGGRPVSTPMLIGPTLVPEKKLPVPKDEEDTPLSSQFIALIVGFLGVVACFMVALNLWFRRGDRLVRQRLDQLHAQRALEGLENPLPDHSDEQPPSFPPQGAS